MIYFIEAVGLDRVKIGYSKTPTKRMAELQTGSPVKLKMIRFCQGEMWEEKQLHKQLSHFREIGEWFRLSGFVRTIIERYKNKEFTKEFHSFGGNGEFEGIDSYAIKCFGCEGNTHARFASKEETQAFSKTYPVSCNYGLYITVVTCEYGCGINSYIAIGDHKGDAYLMTARMGGFTVCCGKEADSKPDDDNQMRCAEECEDRRPSLLNDFIGSNLDNQAQTSSDELPSQDAS